MNDSTAVPDRPSTPSLSVVVVILGNRSYLLGCLEGLRRQAGVPRFEIIVPHDATLEDVPELESRFPGVTFLAHDGRRTYAELRASGFRHANGDIVALTEDHCTPEEDWCANILRLHQGPYAAVGGSVDKSGDDTVLNWAIYLNDFGRYMNPVPEGPAAYLTDCNVSYKRSHLEGLKGLWAEEFHETTVNWALLERGNTLWLSPTVVVRQQRSLQLGPALRERYEFGRLFASTRVASVGAARRLLYAAASPILPVILLGRVAKNVFGKRRAIGRFVQAVPMLVLLALMWTWGEFLGYLTGRAATELRPAVPSPAA
jgi:glycosyltransferase involved in cell wall biosynthesis